MQTSLKTVVKDLKLFLLGILFSGLLLISVPIPVLATNHSPKLSSTPLLTPLSTFAADPVDNTNTNTTDSTDNESDSETEDDSPRKDVCRTETGSVGWIVCPVVNFLAKTTDGIYDAIESFLVVQPLTFTSDNAYHQVWSLFRDATNIIFIIFLTVVIYSQLTGLGISNYGVKRALPKLIVSVILINLSYIICALMVDCSNILGASIRDIFSSIESAIVPTGILAQVSEASEPGFLDFLSLTGFFTGAAVFGGLAISMNAGLGTIFLSLVPVLFAAIISIIIAYITIAARQAFVFILIMVSPLAFVASILPNTEKWFMLWKKSLYQMLFFYPIFGILFGASSLVSWVIIAAADSYLFIILGMAVKVVPLFSAWRLLKMSGTFPGHISATLTAWTRRPLVSASRPFAEEAARRRAIYFGGRPRPNQPFRRTVQGFENIRNRRILDTVEYIKASKTRGLGYAAEVTRLNGELTRRGEGLYDLIGTSLETQTKVAHKDNLFEQGVQDRTRSPRRYARLVDADNRVLNAADSSYMESVRSEWIKHQNASSRRDRFNQAMEAHDQSLQYGRPVDTSALTRYSQMNTITEGDVVANRFITANATVQANNQDRLIASQFEQYFSALPPTQHVEDALKDITNQGQSGRYIEPIIAGLRVLNARGDTNLVKDHLKDALAGGQIQLGTHASQALANFLMFETKDTDFTLRRFGKYINLETARVFNEGQSTPNRQNRNFDMNEYVTGTYIDYYDANGNPVYGKSKLPMVELLKGTPIKAVERTAFQTFDELLRETFGDDTENLAKVRSSCMSSLMPAVISAGLSYESGSEPLVNLASWITGLKQKKDGSWEKLWEKEGHPLFGLTEDQITNGVMSYLGAQTPAQVYSMRTDILNPCMEIFANAFEKHPHDYDPLVRGEKADRLYQRLENLQTQEDDLTRQITDLENRASSNGLNENEQAELEKLKKKRANVRKKRRFSESKIVVKDLLHKKDKLIQIYNTRRSGGSNNAKDVIRDLLEIDNTEFIDNYRQLRDSIRRSAENEDYQEPDDPGPQPADNPLYDASVRAYYQERINERFYDNRDDPEAFYDEAYDYLSETFGPNHNITTTVKRYHDSQNPNATSVELCDYIISVLSNPDNY